MRNPFLQNKAGNQKSVAIACGGTGGHLFPGLAVADQLVKNGCRVTLLISPKEVDQHAVENTSGMHIITLPAVGLKRGGRIAFARGFAQSYRAAKKCFSSSPPDAALAMGGFTSAPPILAARLLGAPTFLHESNTIPGRANRFLSWIVDHAFVGFASTRAHLKNRKVIVTGTPVRQPFHARDPRASRAALGLDPDCPALLVMGGSQGASGINELVIQSLPLFAELAPQLQWFHLTGPTQVEAVQRAYRALNLKAVVHPFFAEMELALGAASAAITRAGASSLAELAAMRVPAVLIPYPAATDNHQFENARAFQQSGAACLLEQKSATPERLAELLLPLVRDDSTRAKMQRALARWHAPEAAQRIAQTILNTVAPREIAAAPVLTSDEPASFAHQTSTAA